MDELQHDVDDWISKYNILRLHSGRYCDGKTPIQTFLDSKHIAIEKQHGVLCQHNEEISDILDRSDICQINLN